MPIEGEDQLKAWLAGKPRDVLVAIAFRAAARALPFLSRVDWTDERFFELAKYVFRCNLVTYCFCFQKDKKAYAAATAAAADAFTAVYAAEAYVAAAAYAAADAAYAYAAAAAAYAAATAAAAADAYADTFWKQLDLDIQVLKKERFATALLVKPLWNDTSLPDELRDAWQEMESNLSAKAENWQFWIDYYQHLLKGGAPSQDYLNLLADIVLMPNKKWKKDAPEVNAIIARKYEAYISTQFPRPEKFILDKKNLTISVKENLQPLPDNIKNNIIRKIKNAISFYKQNYLDDKKINTYTCLKKPFAQLEHAFNDENLDISGLFDECEEMQAALAKLIDSDELPDDAYSARLISEFSKSTADIVGNVPEVRKMLESRIDMLARTPDTNTEKEIIGALNNAIALSVGALKFRLENIKTKFEAWVEAKMPVHKIAPWQYNMVSYILHIREILVTFPNRSALSKRLEEVHEYALMFDENAVPYIILGSIAYKIIHYFNKNKQGS